MVKPNARWPGKLVRRLAAGLCALAVACGDAREADDTAFPPAPPPLNVSATPAPALVRDVLASVAGTYHRGGAGLWSETLELQADGTYWVRFSGCMGPSEARGTVTVSGRLLLFDDARSTGPTADGALDAFAYVPWGERLYLVRESSKMAFCNAANAGSEPRDEPRRSYTFLRNSDWMRPAPGLPSVPDEWRILLCPEPLTGTTFEADDGSIWADIGADDGLESGMELILHRAPTGLDARAHGAPPVRDQPLTVLRIEADRCQLRFKWAHERRPPIPVRMTVSTAGSEWPPASRHGGEQRVSAALPEPCVRPVLSTTCWTEGRFSSAPASISRATGRSTESPSKRRSRGDSSSTPPFIAASRGEKP